MKKCCFSMDYTVFCCYVENNMTFPQSGLRDKLLIKSENHPNIP